MAVRPPVRRLDWDSDFWGLEVGAAEPAAPVTDPTAVLAEVDRCAAGFDVVFVRVPGTEVALLGGAVGEGFELLELTVVLAGAPGDGDWRRGRVRAGTPADADVVGSVASTSFRPWGRFYRDARMRDRADDLYRSWAVNSLAGFADFVLVTDDDPAGFVTGHLDPDGTGRLGLLGVAAGPAWGRLGTAQRLLRSVLDRFGDAGASRVLFETQSHNLPMLRALGAAGCTLDNVSACLHKWYR